MEINSGLIFGVLLLLAVVSFSEERDVYEKIDHLVNKLEYWQNNVVKLPEQQIDTRYQATFSQYNVKIDSLAPKKLRLQLSLPLYMGSLTTRIRYLIEDSVSSGRAKYIRNIGKTDSSFFYDDSIEIFIDNCDKREAFFPEIQKRFQFYRTIKFPPEYKTDPVKNISEPVQLTVLGRDNVHIKYNRASRWFLILQKLALNRRLYTGLVSISTRDSIISAKFYISLTAENARGHHFFVIDEKFGIEGNRFCSKDYKVKFYPYVRFDNVLNIFKREEYDSSGDVKINLH